MLEDKVAIITGGTRGIGYETAKIFLENKAKVIILGSREGSVQKALDELKKSGFEAEGYWPNLSSYEEITEMVEKVKEKYGKIDILVNNAGISAKGPIEETEVAEFEKIIDLNVQAMFRMIKAVVPIMKEQGDGVILNTSSMVSIYGQPSGVGYPASKFAVNGITKSLARELAPAGIRVNAVAPGVIRTDMMKDVPEEMIAPIIQTIPLGRIGEPRDIANAFLFLASDSASYITGEILSVDGAARA